MYCALLSTILRNCRCSIHIPILGSTSLYFIEVLALEGNQSKSACFHAYTTFCVVDLLLQLQSIASHAKTPWILSSSSNIVNNRNVSRLSTMLFFEGIASRNIGNVQTKPPVLDAGRCASRCYTNPKAAGYIVKLIEWSNRFFFLFLQFIFMLSGEKARMVPF